MAVHENYSDYFKFDDGVNIWELEQFLAFLEDHHERSEDGQIHFSGRSFELKLNRCLGKSRMYDQKVKVTVCKNGEIRIKLLPREVDNV